MSHYDELKNIFDKMGLLYSEWEISTIIPAKSFERKVTELSLVLFKNRREGAEYFFRTDGSFLRAVKY